MENEVYVGKQLFVSDEMKSRANKILSEIKAGEIITNKIYGRLAEALVQKYIWEQELQTAFPELLNNQFEYDGTCGMVTITGLGPAKAPVPGEAYECSF